MQLKEKQVYIISACFLFLASVFSVGYHHPDEHFQVLEFAALKLHMTTADHLPWEYQFQMRPAIQPALVVFAFRVFSLFGINSPFTITFFLRVLSAGLSFPGMYWMYKAYRSEIRNEVLKRWFLLLSFLLWFMVYTNVRFSSECWSGSFFIIAFSLLRLLKSPRGFHYFLIGILLGLSFAFRYQTGFLVAGLVLWHLFIKRYRSASVLLLVGMLVSAGVGIIADRWFYGRWVFTAWNYFQQNIIYDKVSGFGTSPWWFYFEKEFIQAIPPFSIIYILGFVVYFIFYRKDLLTWSVLPFLLLHFIIGHKELRFLFPLIGFLPVVIIKSVEVFKDQWNISFTENPFLKAVVKLFWLVNVGALLVVTFNPANPQIPLFKKIYDDYQTPATLYYAKENPYHRALDVYFYKRENLNIEKINSFRDFMPTNSRKQLFVTQDMNDIHELKGRSKLIYSTFPEWFKNFNFNHWLERSNCWYVYEMY